jgi:hypothetical protein
MEVSPESTLSLFDSACHSLPSYTAWVCGENTRAVIALMTIVGLFGELLDWITGLKTTQFLWKTVKAFIRGSIRESFGEPVLRPWVNKLSPRMKLWLFWPVSALLFVVAFSSFLFSYLGWYPLLAVPFEHMKYGVFTYPILLGWGLFFVVFGVLSIGNAIQFFKLGKRAKSQLKKPLNRTRSKQRAG